MYRFCLLLVFLVLHQASVSNAKPANASTSTCQCGVPNRSSRIQGGIPTEKNEYPWQAGITVTTDHRIPYIVYCGGTVISNQHVLTNAVCCNWWSIDKPSEMSVLLREHDTANYNDGEMKIQVSKITLHPQFNGYTHENDLCVVTLATALDFGSLSNLLAPACLPKDPSELYVGQKGVSSGWGKTSQRPHPTVLQEANMDIVDNADCSIAGKPSLLCTALRKIGPCMGDWGGPLMVPDARLYRYELVGVVSSSRWYPDPPSDYCTFYSRVYARVTTALDWIKQVTAGSTTCP